LTTSTRGEPGFRLGPDGARIATGGKDRTVRIWDAATGREIQKLIGHTGRIWHLAYSHDGR
jgi:WD40 repeat protein